MLACLGLLSITQTCIDCFNSRFLYCLSGYDTLNHNVVKHLHTNTQSFPQSNTIWLRLSFEQFTIRDIGLADWVSVCDLHVMDNGSLSACAADMIFVYTAGRYALYVCTQSSWVLQLCYCYNTYCHYCWVLCNWTHVHPICHLPHTHTHTHTVKESPSHQTYHTPSYDSAKRLPRAWNTFQERTSSTEI